jgi:tight adherence protein C
MAATVVVAGLAVAPVPTVMALAATLALIRARRRSARQRARERDAAALPVALELCAVTLGAGGTVFDCLRILAERGPDPVGEAAAECVQEAGAGARLDAALSRFRDRLGLAFQPLTGALLLAWRQGGSVGLLLARLTSEANASRRRLGELRARRLPVLLLLPLVVFTLPAVLIGTVVPVVVVALRDLDL